VKSSAWFPLSYLLPLVILAILALLESRVNRPPPTPSNHPAAPPSTTKERLILVVLDSLRPEALDDHMPRLREFAAQAENTRVSVTTAGANATMPCMQTLLEGRQSPFVSSIHNFTGAPGGSESLPAIASRSGFGVSIVSDYVLAGLYAQYAISVKKIGSGTSLRRDMVAIQEGLRQLQDPRVRVLILHLAGTDHVAHRWQPGHPEYESHFRTVDEKLAQFLAALDLRTDHLIVTGDHGHNRLGMHDRRSLAIFAGGSYSALLDSIGRPAHLDQTDLLYFLAFPHLLPLPVAYEGNYFGMDQQVPAGPQASPGFRGKFAQFVAVQKTTLAQAGRDAGQIAATADERRAKASTHHRGLILAHLQLLTWYVFWLLVAFRENEALQPRCWPVLATALAWPVLWLAGNPSWGLILTVGTGIWTVVWACRHREAGLLIFVALIALLAAFPAYFAVAWREFFRGDFGQIRGWPTGYEVWLLVALMIVMGGLFALLRYRSWQALPEGIGVFCLFILPSGLYGYQFGSNILRGVLISGVFLATALWLRHLWTARRWPPVSFKSATLMTVLALGTSWFLLLFGQKAYGRNWQLFTLPWMESIRPWLLPALYVSFGVYLIFATSSRRGRFGLFGLLVLMPWYCLSIARLPLDQLVAALFPVVFPVAWLALRGTGWSVRTLPGRRTELAVLVLLAGILMAFWTTFRGYSLDATDFSFGFRFFGDTTSEAQLFLYLYPATLLKYGLPVCLLVSLYLVNADPAERREGFGVLLLLFNLKMLTLLVQIFVSHLGTEEKMYELAVSDLLAVFSLTLLVTANYAGVLTASAAWAAWRRRAQREAPAIG